MIGVDTNVLVRYLAGDPAAEPQTQRAIRRIDEAVAEGVSVFINDVVLCETVWVLEFHYKVPKPALAEALDSLLRHSGFQFAQLALAQKALAIYRAQRIDFADALIAALNRHQGCGQTFSFDRQAQRHLDFKEP